MHPPALHRCSSLMSYIQGWIHHTRLTQATWEEATCCLHEAQIKEVCCLRWGALKVKALDINYTPKIPVSLDMAKCARVQPSHAKMRVCVAAHQTSADSNDLDSFVGRAQRQRKGNLSFFFDAIQRHAWADCAVFSAFRKTELQSVQTSFNLHDCTHKRHKHWCPPNEAIDDLFWRPLPVSCLVLPPPPIAKSAKRLFSFTMLILSIFCTFR